jgi:hypothetical protein
MMADQIFGTSEGCILRIIYVAASSMVGAVACCRVNIIIGNERRILSLSACALQLGPRRHRTHFTPAVSFHKLSLQHFAVKRSRLFDAYEENAGNGKR